MWKVITNSKTNTVSLILILITVISIFITETEWFTKLISYNDNFTHSINYYMFWKYGIQNISFFIMGLAAISLLWELYSKRSFTDEILEKVNLSTHIKDSGIIKIYPSFQDVDKEDWDNLLRDNVKFLKLFFSSSTLWVRQNNEQLNAINLKKRPIDIYIPNYNNQTLLESLSIKDKEPVGTIKNKIETSYKKFLNMQKNNHKLKVILVDEIPIMTFYMNENQIIIATYSLRSKDEKVSTFLVKKDGDLYSFAEKEINYLYEKYGEKIGK